ncbi:MAG: hypothetical protein HYV63_27195 [Candidatus Schekmanbacteria bacterium]|nr:hypothetical protein [Candidatus Schekmanbacteria bacterium]
MRKLTRVLCGMSVLAALAAATGAGAWYIETHRVLTKDAFRFARDPLRPERYLVDALREQYGIDAGQGGDPGNSLLGQSLAGPGVPVGPDSKYYQKMSDTEFIDEWIDEDKLVGKPFPVEDLCSQISMVGRLTPGGWVRHGAGAEDEYLENKDDYEACATTLVPGTDDDYYSANIRAANHFYNPFWATSGYPHWAAGRQQGGLDDVSYVPWTKLFYGMKRTFNRGKPARDWAVDASRITGVMSDFARGDSRDNDWDHEAARRYLWDALTLGAWSCAGQELELDAGRSPCREVGWALTFRAIGHVMHLVEDVSQPEHARNDAHPLYTGMDKWPETKEGRIRNPEPYLAAAGRLDYRRLSGWSPESSAPPAPITADAFFSTDQGVPLRDDRTPGAAELANLYFLTSHTIPPRSSVTCGAGTSATTYASLELQDSATRGVFASPTFADLEVVCSADTPFLTAYIPDPADPTTLFPDVKLLAYKKDDRPDVCYPYHGVGEGEKCHQLPKKPADNPCPIESREDPRCYGGFTTGFVRSRTFWTSNDDTVKTDVARVVLYRAASYASAYLEWFFRGRLSAAPAALLRQPGGAWVVQVVLQNDSDEDLTVTDLAFTAARRRASQATGAPEGNAYYPLAPTGTLPAALPGKLAAPDAAQRRTAELRLPLPAALQNVPAGEIEIVAAVRGTLGREAGAVLGLTVRPKEYVPVLAPISLVAPAVVKHDDEKFCYCYDDVCMPDSTQCLPYTPPECSCRAAGYGTDGSVLSHPTSDFPSFSDAPRLVVTARLEPKQSSCSSAVYRYTHDGTEYCYPEIPEDLIPATTAAYKTAYQPWCHVPLQGCCGHPTGIVRSSVQLRYADPQSAQQMPVLASWPRVSRRECGGASAAALDTCYKTEIPLPELPGRPLTFDPSFFDEGPWNSGFSYDDCLNAPGAQSFEVGMGFPSWMYLTLPSGQEVPAGAH